MGERLACTQSDFGSNPNSSTKTYSGVAQWKGACLGHKRSGVRFSPPLPRPQRSQAMRQMTTRQYSEWLSRASRSNSCGKKVKFNSESKAQERAKAKALRFGAMNAYLCQYCACWHIGHTPDPALYGIEIVTETPSTPTESREIHALSMKFD